MATYKDIEPIINDFTDRVRLLQTDYKNLPWAKRTEMDFTEIVMALKRAPTADVREVKHGRWEEIRNPYGELEGWICKCGRQVVSKDNYCPNCGANMMDEEAVKNV